MTLFCLLHLCPNKEKETQNKIKENKKKGKLNKTKSIVHNSDTTRKSLSSENPKSIIHNSDIEEDSVSKELGSPAGAPKRADTWLILAKTVLISILLVAEESCWRITSIQSCRVVW